ncbi:hypothetical protein [Adlercreutzia agrestimuris]|uniref:hypothetical protein n=1 Tax=Adlercreutzia agrestimuris TaxID=2941324 RepID=UPI00204157DF|nr:hypothetical protein [Adlercreutzia agrestimuris]
MKSISQIKILLIAFISCLMVVSLLACSPGSSNSSSTSSSTSSNSSTETNDDPESIDEEIDLDEDDSDDGEYGPWTLDEMLAIGSYQYSNDLFIKRGNEYFSLDSDTFSGPNPLTQDEEYKGPMAVLDKSAGEELVTTSIWEHNDIYGSEDGVRVYKIIGEEYVPSEYPVNWTICDEINGIEVSTLSGDDTDERIANYLLTLGIEMDVDSNTVSSKEPTSFTIGTYVGTKFEEEVIDLSEHAYLADTENFMTLPLEKTKEGYFIVNTEQLTSGMYSSLYASTNTGVHKYCIFEVV